jgi:hypothetical protein
LNQRQGCTALDNLSIHLHTTVVFLDPWHNSYEHVFQKDVESLRQGVHSSKQKAWELDDMYYRSQYDDAPALRASDSPMGIPGLTV